MNSKPSTVAELTDAILSGAPLTDPAFRALAFLKTGDHESAHPHCQDDPRPIGSALHCVVHRLEGDLANARYWSARAGDALPDLSRKALTEGTTTLVPGEWEALAASALERAV